MARVSAGYASVGHLLPIALAAIGLCSADRASAHGGRLNAQGCHRDRKHDGYRCHRSGATSSRGDSVPQKFFVPSRASRRSNVFANCTEARAASAMPVRRGKLGYGSHMDRDEDGVGCESRRK